MKTRPGPRLRYRPPKHWPLYFGWDNYAAPIPHKHKWIRISGDGASDTVIICVQCGEPA